jgi:hypothetical protein
MRRSGAPSEAADEEPVRGRSTSRGWFSSESDRGNGRLLRSNADVRPRPQWRRVSSRLLPPVLLFRRERSDRLASFMTGQSMAQKPVIWCVHMPDVSSHCELDGLRLQLFGCGGTANPPGIFPARMFGNGVLLLERAPRKECSYALRKCLDVFVIQFLTTLSRTLSSESTTLGVGQAFLLRSCERGFFDQHTLPLIALARTAEAHDDSAQCRVATGPASERGVSTTKEYQVIEIGTGEAEWPVGLHAKKATLPECLTAFRAG